MTTTSPTFTPFSPFKGVRGATLTLLLIFLSIILLGLSTAVYNFVYLTEQQAWEGRQQEATSSATNQVNAFLDRADVIVQMVDTMNALPEAAGVPLTTALAELVQQNGAIEEILVLDGNGQLLGTASQTQPILANLFTIPQSVWFLEARAGNQYLSDLQFTADNRAYVILAHPTRTNGVVAVLLRMDVLRDIVAQVQLGDSGHTYLVNAAGQILSHTDFDIVLDNTSINSQPELTLMRDAPNFAWSGSYTNFEDEAVVGTSDGVPNTNWILVTEVLQSEAYATSRNALLFLGGGTILIWLFAMTFTSGFLQRLVYGPLAQLQGGAQHVEQGDLDYRVPVLRDDEIGAVTSSFNEMVGRVNERTQATTTLYQISQALTRARSLEDITRAVVEIIPSDTTNSCHLFMLQPTSAPSGRVLELESEWHQGDIPTLPSATQYSMGDSAFTRLLLMDSQEAQLIENVATDNRLDPYTRQVLLSLEHHTTAIIPIVQAGRWTGVMARSWQGAHTFSDSEASVYQALPALIAPVVQNLQLVEDLEGTVENLRIAREVAEESSRLKGEFLSTVSHELRTPLNAIEGYTGIMMSGFGGVQLEPKAHRMVERVRLNSRRLLGLVNDFLDLSRIEAGRVELVTLPFSPSRLVSRWQAETGILTESKGLTFTAYIDPSLPETLLGDEDALSKVVLNLLSNAIKFTETGEVSLRLLNQGDTLAIEVKDSGIGIPSSAREYIFDEFRQVDGSSTRKFGGTGLGLAIVQKLVRLMNGKISLQSEVGVGSTFTIQLPLQHQMVPALEEL